MGGGSMSLNFLVNWKRKSCNTCARGGIHHSGTLTGNYNCSVSKKCHKFDAWVPHNNYAGRDLPKRESDTA
jgi:hypothetical protein